MCQPSYNPSRVSRGPRDATGVRRHSGMDGPPEDFRVNCPYCQKRADCQGIGTSPMVDVDRFHRCATSGSPWMLKLVFKTAATPIRA